MTIGEKNSLLDAYYVEVSDLKYVLAQTDYQSIREFEGGEPMPDYIREKRAMARARINELQELISKTKEIEPEEPVFDFTLGEAADAPAEDAPVVDSEVADTPVEDVPVVDSEEVDSEVADATVADSEAVDAPVEDAPVADSEVVDSEAEDAPVADAEAVDSK